MLTPSRHRTRVACLTCRRKKLKCDGLQPCSTCSGKAIDCAYMGASVALHEQRPLPPFIPAAGDTLAPRDSMAAAKTGASASIILPTAQPRPTHRFPPYFPAISPRPLVGGMPAAPTESRSSMLYSTTSVEQNEEESLDEASRMLQDGRGRLLYLGDSASLSYLDTIRRLVERTVGVSRFTSDPHKHSLLELSISAGLKATHVLPDRETAEFLIDSFFSNTIGIMQILDRDAFIDEVASIYGNPLQAEQPRVCLLNLVFAVGLQMCQSSVAHSFRESQILKRLGPDLTERAKIFYLNAAHFNDPSSGFEDGDITSIQALLLITLFMLTIAKRNAAWAYFGMAVRSAYALGLHRKNASLGFSSAEQRVRRNLWGSMYILDCFLSASLGRPNGIHHRDAADIFVDANRDDQPNSELEVVERTALRASVRAARLLGEILSSVYAERKISVKFVQKCSKQFQDWKDVLPAALHWRNISLPNEDPRTTLAQLHVNLYYFHGVILLTRPFLLQKILSHAQYSKISNDNTKLSEAAKGSAGPSAHTDSFSAACVRAASYSIDIVQSAILKRTLPRRDPFVIYWLFTASLILFSNVFCPVCDDVDSSQAMETSLDLHRYLAETDPLAQRYLEILTSFHEAIGGVSGLRMTTSSARDTNVTILSNFFGEQPRISAANPSSTNMPMMGNTNRYSLHDSQGFPANSTPRSAEIQPGNSGHDMFQMSPNMSVTEISPPDYSLDFDNFLSLVDQVDGQAHMETVLDGTATFLPANGL